MSKNKGVMFLLIVLFSSLFYTLAFIPPASAWECGVDVYGLDVLYDNHVAADLRNTGSQTETITYRFLVNGRLAHVGALELAAGESEKVSFTHDFDVYQPRKPEQYYEIVFEAESECGAVDSDEMAHVKVISVGDWTENYKCSGDWLLREFRYNDGGTAWVEYEHCKSGCNNGMCGAPPVKVTQDCGVSIKDIDVHTYISGNEKVHALEVVTKNTGECPETMELNIYIDNLLEDSRAFALAEGGNRKSVFYLFGPGPGEYAIEAVAEADCGASDTEFFILHVPHPQSMDGMCSLDVEAFDYNDYIRHNDLGWISITARNKWHTTETVFLRFYVDGELMSTESEPVIVQGKFSHVFYYPASQLAVGSHEVRVDAYTQNGCLNIKQATVYVYDAVEPPQPICNYNGVCEQGETSTNCPNDCIPEPVPEPIETNVDIYPSSLDIYQREAKVITLEITTGSEQDFGISAVGVDDSWLHYNKKVYAERGTQNFYIYVNPQETGSYKISVLVTALSEGVSFSSEMPLYVASPKSETTKGFDFAVLATPVFIALFIALGFFIVIAVGSMKLRQEKPVF